LFERSDWLRKGLEGLLNFGKANSPEDRRSIELAKNLGFTAVVMPDVPNAGGFFPNVSLVT